MCGMVSVWIASLYTNIEFLWFNVVGCVVTVVSGYIISLTVTKPPNAAAKSV